MDDVTDKLLRDGIDDVRRAVRRADRRRRAGARGDRHGPPADDQVARFPTSSSRAIAERVKQAQAEDVAQRVWRKDESLWGGPGVPEIGNRLGWLTISEKMLEHARRPARRSPRRSRPTGSTDVRAARHGRLEPRPRGDPALVRRHPGRAAPARARLDRPRRRARRSSARRPRRRRSSSSPRSRAGRSRRSRTCATSSSATGSDGSQLRRDHRPGQPARSSWREERGFRRVFENDPDIGGRYSVLSYFGLVPAALMGVNIEALLDRAQVAEQNCAQLRQHGVGNSGLWLGDRDGRAGAAAAATSSRSSSPSRSRASASGSSS